MARKLDQEGEAYRKVLGFTFRQWKHQPWTLGITFAAFMAATVLDVLTPLYAGRLVDAVAQGGDAALNAAIEAFAILIALGLGAVVMRQIGFMAIIQFTLKMMADTAQDRLLPRPALLVRLACQHLRGLDCAQGDARHVGHRSAQRRADHVPVPLAGHAGGHHDRARPHLADDGRHRRRRFGGLYRRHRMAVGQLRVASREPRQHVGHPHGWRTGRCDFVQCSGQRVRRRGRAKKNG